MTTTAKDILHKEHTNDSMATLLETGRSAEKLIDEIIAEIDEVLDKKADTTLLHKNFQLFWKNLSAMDKLTFWHASAKGTSLSQNLNIERAKFVHMYAGLDILALVTSPRQQQKNKEILNKYREENK